MPDKGTEEKVNADNLGCKLEQVIYATLIHSLATYLHFTNTLVTN